MEDKFGNEIVKCKYCGKDTINIDWICDNCWEMEKRIVADPALAMKIFNNLVKEGRAKM